MADINPEEFGAVKANTEACKEGITEIKTLFSDHLKVYREDMKEVNRKSDKAHERVDTLSKEYSKDKGKALGFLAAMSAFWALIIKWIAGLNH